MTVRELQQAMADGRLTARRIVEALLARIDTLDRRGPTLRAIVEVNPDALATADARDAERRSGRVRGPLHGIPVLVKDNIATGDRMLTTAGSLAFTTPAPRDAFLIRRLREAGAVLLGKTNLSEWANFRSTHSSSGWSARGGQTRNAHAADRNPSGSSSGSAVAVAAGLAPLAVGTETDGSIVSPASVNGVVGVKPTLGLVSRSGIVPIAHSQDTAGPLARTVDDALLLLAAMAGPDTRDDVTKEQAGRRPLPSRLDAGVLRGARIGVVRRPFFGDDEEVDRLAANAISVLRAQGAVIVDPVAIATIGTFEEDEFTVLLHEFKHDIARFFDWWGPSAPLRSVADIITFNRVHRAEELRHFDQDLLERADAAGPLTSPVYLAARARARTAAREDGIDAAFARHRLDALVAPTGGRAWVLDTDGGDTGSAFRASPASITSVAGYPHVTVPMGSVAGLPVGLSFFGPAWSDGRLLGFAYAFEQATHHRVTPTFQR